MSLTVLGSNGGGGYNLESSLRLRSSASAYLSWTPASAGNRRTWTWSGWVKRGTLGAYQNIFFGSTGDYNTNDVVTFFRFDNTDTISFFDVTAGVANNFYYSASSRVFRDTSAWYHFVVKVDTTQATASDRLKIYVNGEEITSWSSTVNPSLNAQTGVNSSTGIHRIGFYTGINTQYFDGYMTEVNFVDGQALTPSDFGETDDTTGVWKPKEYTGTYGTNGFYLPFKETQQATGFNTVLYTGTGVEQTIDKVGFSPDLVWVKRRDNSVSYHRLIDSVRGGDKRLASNDSGGETTASTLIQSFDADGYTVGTDTGMNASGDRYVAWCWDAGSSTVSNTDGSITSSVRANPASGFSIVTYTGNGSSGTVGHGLGSAPEMIIIKNRSQADGWYVWHQNNGAGIYGYLFLNSTDQVRSSTPQFGTTAPDSSVISLTYNTNDWANASGENYVAYCFSEVAGYSKFGSYTGNGSVGNSVTGLGFEPAFLLIKNATDLGGSGESWYLYDNARDPVDTRYHKLNPNGSSAESTSTVNNLVDFDSDGFTIQSTNAGLNYNGDTYIYMAFADTRDAQFNFDVSGNKNNWTANNINSNASSQTTYDIMNDVATLTDEDTANFATLNPLASNSVSTLSNANLDVTASTVNYNERATIELPSSGKWYFESYLNTVDCVMGVMKSSIANNAYMGFSTDAWIFVAVNGNKANGSQVSYDSASVVGQTIGIAMNMDNGELTFYRNGVSLGVAFTIADTSNLVFGIGQSTNALRTVNANFGQQPFKYSMPTGFKKLNTYNLPDSTIKDGSQYFISNTFTGTGSTLSIDTGFSPDFVWLKSRSFADHPLIYDSIRGANKRLYSSLTNAESTATDQLNSFNSDGYTLGSDPSGQINVSGQTSVGWSWRASDSSPVSNTDGTITSTVSANPTSGFSVVTYTGNGTNPSTIGHGLGAVPKFIISKARTGSPLTTTEQEWNCYSAELGNDKKIILNNTNAVAASSNWGSTTPTSSVYTVGAGGTNGSGSNFVAYCFAEVEGFSKFGSYTGNGSADGPFIYTGFRPTFVLVKDTTQAKSWMIQDSARDTYNVAQYGLSPDLSDAEAVSGRWDILSNGFKLRTAGSFVNGSGDNYIYMAFAENPFKNSLAR